MSKSFKYVKEFEFPSYGEQKYACGGSVKKAKGGKAAVPKSIARQESTELESISTKRKHGKEEVGEAHSLKRQSKVAVPVAPPKGAFNREPLIPMKKGGSAKKGCR